MGQSCQVCSHSKRLAIDRQLVAGKNILEISRIYSVSADSLYNHKSNHITRQMLKHRELQDIFIGKDLIQVIEDLLQSTQNILSKTENDPKKFGIALKAIREMRETVRLLFETALKLQELKQSEYDQDHRADSVQWQDCLRNLEVAELELLKALLMKGQGKRPGRRTDLEPKKTGPKPGAKHPHAVKIEPQRQRRRRRKPAKEPEDEFDQMRSRMGLSNNPEPEQPGDDLPW